MAAHHHDGPSQPVAKRARGASRTETPGAPFALPEPDVEDALAQFPSASLLNGTSRPLGLTRQKPFAQRTGRWARGGYYRGGQKPVVQPVGQPELAMVPGIAGLPATAMSTKTGATSEHDAIPVPLETVVVVVVVAAAAVNATDVEKARESFVRSSFAAVVAASAPRLATASPRPAGSTVATAARPGLKTRRAYRRWLDFSELPSTPH
ncbi:hypothetical protein BZA05DRAFT_445122 [Tricharina praecox]|uniref:uncharacterized protein n=1 Tax=Tricharina praecox TaxID=43433 RepID=UPI00221FD34D|nr:uncharacterized protein BZA05DRAFT_445122 [Tricharina praecox]KAI5851958.1 hypothetical protein BZA05DRAFT_445122 [Tricharina praecox]